jgi:hypothetical protein
MSDEPPRALGAASSAAVGAPVRAVPSLPAELVAVDAATRAALAVAGRADEWDGPTRAGVLAWVAHHRDVLAVLEGRVLTAEREAGTWSLRGDRDLAGFVGRTSHQGRGAGLAAVGQAGTLAAMPAVAEALVDGPVTTTHVVQITRATAGSPTLAAELATPEGQVQVVELARRLDGGEFGKALQQLSASLDPAARQRSHDEQRADRSLAWTHTAAGTLVKGRLDNVAGHKLAKAIDALCPRLALDDDRSREQRQADALMAIVERAAADSTTTPGSVAPVQAVVTFTQETWTALRGAQPAVTPSSGRRSAVAPGPARTLSSGRRPAGVDRPAGAGDEVAAVAGRVTVDEPAPGSAMDVARRLRGREPVVDETGQAWPASEVARALCDCALTWAMVGTRAATLDLGRDSRCFKRQHWLALYAAGVTGCSIGGCGIPLAYCELHHAAWWLRDGGETTPANCAAYCSFHHHEIHRLGIVVTRRDDGRLEHRHPDGRPYGASPQRVAESRSLLAGRRVPAGERSVQAEQPGPIGEREARVAGPPEPTGERGARLAGPPEPTGERGAPAGKRSVPAGGRTVSEGAQRAPTCGPAPGDGTAQHVGRAGALRRDHADIGGDGDPPPDLFTLLSA